MCWMKGLRRMDRWLNKILGDENFFAPKHSSDAPKTGKVADRADEKSIA